MQIAVLLFVLAQGDTGERVWRFTQRAQPTGGSGLSKSRDAASKVSRFFWHKLTHSLEESIDQPRLFGDPLTEVFTLLFSLSRVAAVLVVTVACSFGSTRILRSTVHPASCAAAHR